MCFVLCGLFRTCVGSNLYLTHVYLQHVCTYSSSKQGRALTLLALFTSAPAVTSSLTTAVWSGCGEGALGGWGRGEQSHQCIFL